MSGATKRQLAIISLLEQMYPDASTELSYSSPFQLLVAVILAAQCTDKRVNQVTERLFQEADSPIQFANLEPAELEPKIRSCGLGPAKAKHLVEASRIILERHGGQVPHTEAELRNLPGVGPKTAKVMLANAFGVPAIAVDTHVFRVANRLGLAKANSPDATGRQLEAIAPRERWIGLHHELVWHGRRVCHARNPNCDVCPLLPYCPHGQSLLSSK